MTEFTLNFMGPGAQIATAAAAEATAAAEQAVEYANAAAPNVYSDFSMRKLGEMAGIAIGSRYFGTPSASDSESPFTGGGSLASSSSLTRIYVPIEELPFRIGDEIVVRELFETAGAADVSVSFCNAAGSAISTVAESTSAGLQDSVITGTIPANTVYILANILSSGAHKVFGLAMGFSPATPSYMQAAEIEASASGAVDSPLAGKTVVIMGDSIADDTVDVVPNPDVYLETLLAEKWGATVIDCAFGGSAWTKIPADTVYGPFSGSALAEAIKNDNAGAVDAWDEQDAVVANPSYTGEFGAELTALKAVEWWNVHAIIVMLGTNDYGNARTIGTNSDTGRDTVKGAVINFLTDMLSTYPHLKIALVTPLYRDRFAASRSGTASISGSTLTVATATGGTSIAVGDSLYMVGVERRTTITALGTGTGGTGTYSLSRFFGDALSTRTFVTADADNNGYTYANSASKTLTDYADAIQEIAQLPQFAVPVFDAYRESGLNPLTATRLTNDGLHPSPLIGLYALADIIAWRVGPLLAGSEL